MTVVGTAVKCAKIVHDAVQEGAIIVTGEAPKNDGGCFVKPLLLTGVTDGMKISREEIFAPIVSVLRFSDAYDVIRRANDTEMGLAAYVYTESMSTALWASDALEYGMVAVNTYSFTGPPLPFGGGKQSGLGREGSTMGIYEYLENKNVSFGGLASRPKTKEKEMAR